MRPRGLLPFAFSWTLLSAIGGCGKVYPLPSTPGVDPRAQVEGPIVAAGTRFRPSVCTGVPMHPEYAPLDESALLDFLKGQKLAVQAARARNDLVFVELRLNPDAEPVRLRVAILSDTSAAGRELHAAVLQHGRGSWGVHRSNLAVLIPDGKLEDIVAFAAATHLACWGVVTVNDGSEAFVIPGGYREI